MPPPVIALRCKVCDDWLPAFPRHLRSFVKELLCVDCVLWFGKQLGFDENQMMETWALAFTQTRRCSRVSPEPHKADLAADDEEVG